MPTNAKTRNTAEVTFVRGDAVLTQASTCDGKGLIGVGERRMIGALGQIARRFPGRSKLVLSLPARSTRTAATQCMINSNAIACVEVLLTTRQPVAFTAASTELLLVFWVDMKRIVSCFIEVPFVVNGESWHLVMLHSRQTLSVLHAHRPNLSALFPAEAWRSPVFP